MYYRPTVAAGMTWASPRSWVLQQPRQQQAVCSKPDLAWTVQSPETLLDVRSCWPTYSRRSRSYCCCSDGFYDFSRMIFIYFLPSVRKLGSTSDKAYSRLLGSRYVHAHAHRRPRSHFWVFAAETSMIVHLGYLSSMYIMQRRKRFIVILQMKNARET